MSKSVSSVRANQWNVFVARGLILLCLLSQSPSNADLPENYQELPGCSKRRLLYETEILESEYKILPPFSFGGFSTLLGSSALLSLDKSFSHTSDEMPKGRLKVIHTYGSVAPVDFISVGDHDYTGLYKGACGLVRLGWAAPPAIAGYTPGMAFKLFVSRQPSKNLHVMHSLDGQGQNSNFFENVFTNIIPKPEGLMLRAVEKVFALFVTRTTHLDVSHLGRVSRRGTPVENPISPFQLYFVPTEAVQLPQDNPEDLRRSLAKIEAGTVIYEVFAREEFSEEAIQIGWIRTTDRFVASKYGDEKLFFQHDERFLKEEFKNQN